ncbi:hypothetical protein [Pseudarthrobacter sp. AG30]|uniref:hypothetical protein n=1 Tax=Pseudarthrobacter sp. AG30 TaxID=2249742 RepID=UPI0010579CEA|nr:hypothetical protein [Pseudarthrobacter sp. AG30]
MYLDQNKWVDLARAATGHRDGARFVAALESARAAASSGTASFPLDIYRYLETGKRRDDRSRIDVADLMFELSKQHTMARPHALLPAEIDQALNRRFGRMGQPRQVDVFGAGLRHITADAVTWPSFDPSRLPGSSTEMGPSALAEIEQIHSGLVELELLRMGPEAVRKAGFDPSDADLAQQFIDYENSVAAAIRGQRLSGGLLELAVRASDLGGIRTAVTEALESKGMTWEDFIERMTPSDLVNFIDDLPSRYVTNVMRSAKLRQAEQKWEPNDFNDLAALPVAAVYCDVVVTEKQWVHRLRQGKIEQRYNTTLLSDTAALVDLLVASTA